MKSNTTPATSGRQSREVRKAKRTSRHRCHLANIPHCGTEYPCVQPVATADSCAVDVWRIPGKGSVAIFFWTFYPSRRKSTYGGCKICYFEKLSAAWHNDSGSSCQLLDASAAAPSDMLKSSHQQVAAGTTIRSPSVRELRQQLPCHSRPDCARAHVRVSTSPEPGVTLLDYGAGNVRSVKNALRQLGQEWNEVSVFARSECKSDSLSSNVTFALAFFQVKTPDDILTAQKLIFPGVGAYEQAMQSLVRQGLVDALREYIQVRSSCMVDLHQLFQLPGCQSARSSACLKKAAQALKCWVDSLLCTSLLTAVSDCQAPRLTGDRRYIPGDISRSGFAQKQSLLHSREGC